MDTKRLGVFGEKIAENYLKKKGYKILDKNYSLKFSAGPKAAEIDIVAKKSGIISFVEVKTISLPACGKAAGGKNYFAPEQKVNFRKQMKIIKTAENWLEKKKVSPNQKWQIDVLSIKVSSASKKALIWHLKNAVFC